MQRRRSGRSSATDRREPSPGSASGAPVAERSNSSDCIRAPERRGRSAHAPWAGDISAQLSVTLDR